jgi:F0F1-type ATP synthase membrane subunit b/b'
MARIIYPENDITINMSYKKELESNITTSSSQLKKDQQQVIDKALDQTREDIRKSVDEAKREIPRYTRAINEYQEQTIEATRELADNFVVSQKEIINSFQSAWAPYIENYTRNVNTYLSPGRISEVYTNTTRSYADNIFTVTRLTNNVIFGYAEAVKNSLQQAKNNAKELSRIGVNAAKTFEQTSKENSRLAQDITTK